MTPQQEASGPINFTLPAPLAVPVGLVSEDLRADHPPEYAGSLPPYKQPSHTLDTRYGPVTVSLEAAVFDGEYGDERVPDGYRFTARVTGTLSVNNVPVDVRLIKRLSGETVTVSPDGNFWRADRPSYPPLKANRVSDSACAKLAEELTAVLTAFVRTLSQADYETAARVSLGNEAASEQWHAQQELQRALETLRHSAEVIEHHNAATAELIEELSKLSAVKS